MWVGVLGPLVVEVGGAPVDVGSSTMRRALLHLTLHVGRVVTTDRLAHAVWGSPGTADVAHAVHSLVYRLRRQLSTAAEDAPLVRRGPGYCLDLDPSAVDVNVFERLLDDAHGLVDTDPSGARAAFGSALELWRGEPYLDVCYESWAMPESRRVCERYVTALETMARCDVASGNLDRAIAELTALTGTFPLRETLWELLWRALAASGRCAEVVRSHQECTRVIEERYGIAALGHLDTLARRIVDEACS